MTRLQQHNHKCDEILDDLGQALLEYRARNLAQAALCRYTSIRWRQLGYSSAMSAAQSLVGAETDEQLLAAEMLAKCLDE